MHYYAYEFAHAVLSPMRLGMQRDAQRARLAVQSDGQHAVRPPSRRGLRSVREHHAPLRQAGVRHQDDARRRRRGAGARARRASTPFCNLLHFERDETALAGKRYDPKVLIVAPMSGHYATLLRGTVKAMLPEHDVYITDWTDARDIPLAMGRFDLDDFIDHVIEFIRVHRPRHARHRRVPAGGAGARRGRAHGGDATIRASRPRMTLMGGPIDTRRNPTRRQQARRSALARLVRAQRRLDRAVPARRLHAPRLSGLHAADRLHDHEPRAPHERARRSVQQSRQGRLRLASSSTRTSTRNISRSWI